MLIITKENILDYLKKMMPEFDTTVPVSISKVGEGTEEDDGDGYVNYIFRIRTGKESYVLKQALKMPRVAQVTMALYRNKLEYNSMRIRYAIVPEYTPFLKFYDEENNIFVMEDVSYLKISRFQFAKNRMFPEFGRQCAEFMAKNEFYTSEFFLSREEYREMQRKFENTELRKIMEDGLFMDMFGLEVDQNLGKHYVDFAMQITNDNRYVTERMKLRRNCISHADALIHGDFHTSNILASDDRMKVIDMEFSFMGPFGYDLGYLTGNIISQYCAACFKPFDSEQERTEYKAYLLATIKYMFRSYFQIFTECWNKDAKKRYQGEDGLRRSVFDEVMRDAPGYASIVNWFRCVGDVGYPDFDVIKNIDDKRHAQTLSLTIDWQLMFQRYAFDNVDDLIDTILFTEKTYKDMM